MNISKIKDFKDFSPLEINQKLLEIEQSLFQLRIKKPTRQAFKSHEFKKLKRQRALLLTLQNQT